MDEQDKAYIGATAVFDAPHRSDFSNSREVKIGVQVLRILNKCTDEEFASVLMACIMILGERLAKKKENKNAK